ncbi:MAG: MBL fold metallo-hydrolase [Gracilibacteraceae bacterium]|jgi:glyoxylase-like metal-dependent hydrolase (beta-lactamase superfamily II)|nr:MBL fold metallo-hydrolase [Gracilibacteraceae bacterium]
MEEIAPGIFMIHVPLPHNPLRELNAYLLRGKPGEKDLLVDLGFNLDECEDALRAALAEVGGGAGFDIVLTHLHIDHAGLLPRFLTRDRLVYSGAIPGPMLRLWEEMSDPESGLQFLTKNGVPPEMLKAGRVPREFRTDWKEILARGQFRELREGRLLACGGYEWRCLETDGHCDGHICLYEPNARLLIAGDHVLGHISPQISCYEVGSASSLNKYLHSLDKVAALEVRLVLPGHREPLTDCRARVAELQTHHMKRLEEIRRILSRGPQTGLAVTEQMTWAINPDSDRAFLMQQRFFALGETLAHINYLIETGTAEMTEKGGLLYYGLK